MDRFRSWKARLLQTTAKRRDTRAHLSKRESHTDRTSVLPRPPGAPEPDTPIKTNKHQFQSRDSSPPQDLWQCAFEQLGQEDQDVLQPSRESTPNQGDENGLRPKNLVEQAIETTENIYEEYQQNGGIKIKTPKGRNVELRKVAGKIINAALSVQDLINKGVACDPTGYAASAWAVVSLGLTMTKNHYDRRDDLFDSAEYLVEVLARCAYYEVKSLWPQSSENHMVRSGLVQVYKAILQYTANVEMARKQDAGRKFLDSITAITSQRIKEGKSSIERTEANLMGLIQLESINTSRKAAEEILTAIDNKLLEPLKDITLNFGLPIAEGAILGFYANQRDNASICLEDTRVDVIAQISRWAESPEGRFFWLNGMAGTGKSTIARTIATLFQAKDQLGATFFFKKDEAERGNAKRFISTIAKQLMSHNHQLASKILDAIKKDPQISAKALSEQFAKLLLRPLQGSTQARNRVMVIVIDALDECSREDLRIILKLLPDLQKIQNIRLKIFLTSRPEHHMCQGIKEMRSDVQILALHGIEDSIVERDIRLFLVKSLEDIRKQNSSLYSTNWPADDAIEKLVKKSVPLFIYADTVCRFIEDGGKQPQLCIDEILESQAGLVGDKMESLYEAVLGQLLNPEFKYGAKRRQKEFRDIVGVIVLLAAPLSIQALGRLLPDPISAGDVRYLLDKLRSVLKVPANDYSPVAVLHESFREFALRTNSEFRVDMQDMHETIASHCLRVMEVLKRDICNLQDYGIKRADIDSQKIKQCLQPELQYSCRYWVYHLERGTALTTKEGISGVHILKFLQRHLLHWLEAMSLIGLISDAVEMIVKLQLMEQKTPDSELSQFLFDTKRFVLRNLHMTETAPLQLYSSALMFSPTESMVRKQFEEERIEKVDILPQVKRSWNANLQTLEGHSDWVRSVVFSPNGQTMASGSDDEMIKLWDAKTGNELQTLVGHSGSVRSVAFSPDGQTVASGSDDHTIKLWDIKLGKKLRTLKGHSGSVRSVAFSPNGKTVASGSVDKMIKLWDAKTGNELKTLKGHSGSIRSVAFSPDGQTVASGSDSRTIKLWDTKTAEELLTLKGHSGSVWSVAFSPNGKTVVSGSVDMMAKLWDTETAEELLTLKGHSGSVWSVVFSLDGQTIASGSDETIKLWDVKTGNELQTLVGHSGSIRSLAFSPDGQTVASGGKTFEIWDAKMGKELQTLEGHSDCIRSMVFSPDGQTMASGSDDMMIKLWDVKTGKEPQTLKGHSGSVHSVVFTPDGQIIASGSDDKMIKLWDITSGKELRTLKGHFGSVRSVAFSPNGKTVASGSVDKMIKLWDAKTGNELQTLVGHSDPVRSVAFSPDGQTVASGSRDMTIKLWNTKTGKELRPLKGHSDSILSMAFSRDGKTIASGSDDETIKLWDAKTGNELQTRVGHSGSVRSVAFSADGQTVASDSYDMTIKLWDAITGEELQTLEGHSHSVESLAGQKSSNPDSQVSIANEWIAFGMKNLIWLPIEYRVFSCSAIQGGALALGYFNGTVSIVGFLTDQ